jgi:hypothetical protein
MGKLPMFTVQLSDVVFGGASRRLFLKQCRAEGATEDDKRQLNIER